MTVIGSSHSGVVLSIQHDFCLLNQQLSNHIPHSPLIALRLLRKNISQQVYGRDSARQRMQRGDTQQAILCEIKHLCVWWLVENCHGNCFCWWNSCVHRSIAWRELFLIFSDTFFAVRFYLNKTSLALACSCCIWHHPTKSVHKTSVPQI